MNRVEQAAERQPLEQPDQHAAMRAEALLGLGTRLEAEMIETLAPLLEPGESAALRAGLAKAPRELEDVFDRMAEAGDVRIGIALEVAHSVYRELAERAAPAVREQVAHSLPPLWAACFLATPKPAVPRVSWFATDLPRVPSRASNVRESHLWLAGRGDDDLGPNSDLH